MLHCIGPLLTEIHRRWAPQRWWKHPFMQLTGRQGLKAWMGYGSLDPPFKDGSNMQLKRSGTCLHPDFCPYPLWHEYARRFKEAIWIKTCFHPCTLPKHGCPRLKETGWWNSCRRTAESITSPRNNRGSKCTNYSAHFRGILASHADDLRLVTRFSPRT